MTTLFFLILSIIVLFFFLKHHEEREKEFQNKINGLNYQHEKEIQSLKEHHIQCYPKAWIQGLPIRFYENEIAVEIKFVLPLLMYLGYSLDEMRIRVPVSLQAGTQSIDCTADWTVTQKSEHDESKMIIEVKSPNVSLDDTVKQQARSYAYALDISKYVITNGRQIIVYERGVERDREILNLTVEEFEQEWNTIKNILGNTITGSTIGLISNT